MRTLRLARIAAEAEGLRFRLRLQRTVTRIVLGIVAMVFVLGAVVFAHISVWYFLRQIWQPQYVALCFLGGDILLAATLGLLASRSSPSRAELEALAVRQRAMEATTSSIAWSTLIFRLLGSLMARSRRR